MSSLGSRPEGFALGQFEKRQVGVAGNYKCDGTAAQAFARAIETILLVHKDNVGPLFDLGKGIASIESDWKPIAKQAFSGYCCLLSRPACRACRRPNIRRHYRPCKRALPTNSVLRRSGLRAVRALTVFP
jgi:hypothetical protein